MATSTDTVRIENLRSQIARRAEWNAKQIAQAEVIEAKIAAGKAKADGPKAKEARMAREHARLGEWEIVNLQAQLDVLTKPVEDLTPEGVDIAIFTIGADIWRKTQNLVSYRQGLAAALFPTANWGRERKPYAINTSQANDWNERANELAAEIDALKAEAAPYEARYDAERWTRYLLCGNNNGHLHYHGCHTLRWDTEVLWVAQASGLDAMEVVGRFGTTACSKCFPGAPV